MFIDQWAKVATVNRDKCVLKGKLFCVKLNQSHRSSSRTINSTPELQDSEIPNDISTLMNIFDPTELDVCRKRMYKS